MVVGRDFYFLCSELESHAEAAPDTARVRALTLLLQRAVSTAGSTEAAVALERYHHAARWSQLTDWSPSEKCEHFLQALELLPDNLHAIDRLAVALAEAKEALTVTGGGRATEQHLRRRAMLLHYALLRGIIMHPLQRPLQLWKGLRSQPFWEPDSVRATQLGALPSWSTPTFGCVAMFRQKLALR